MARPHVADGGTDTSKEGICEDINKAVADSQQGAALHTGGWARC
jgi:hypothetical protein